MILPSITTTEGTGNSWQEKIQEIKRLKIKKIAFFPTVLNQNQRKQIYKEFNKIKGLEIPFMHLRGDFDKKEIDFVSRRYATKFFNVHSEKEYPIPDLMKLKKFICLENTWSKIDDEIDNYSGICLDLAHLESQRVEKSPLYKYFRNLIKKHNIKCAHISIIRKNQPKEDYVNGVGKFKNYHYHYYKKLSDFDYLKRYKNIMPKMVALELENTIEEQLIAKKYIEKIINDTNK